MKEDLKECLRKTLKDTRREPGLSLAEVVKTMKKVFSIEELEAIIKLIKQNA